MAVANVRVSENVSYCRRLAAVIELLCLFRQLVILAGQLVILAATVMPVCYWSLTLNVCMDRFFFLGTGHGFASQVSIFDRLVLLGHYLF